MLLRQIRNETAELEWLCNNWHARHLFSLDQKLKFDRKPVQAKNSDGSDEFAVPDERASDNSMEEHFAE